VRRQSLKWLLVGLVACLGMACAYKNPATPSTTAAVTSGAPASITLRILEGTGTSVGRDVVTATVLDATGKGVPGQTVTFATSAGTVSPSPVVTDSGGLAQSTLVSARAATVTASAGNVQATAVTSAQPLVSITLSVTPAVTLGTATPLAVTITRASAAAQVQAVALDFGDGQVIALDPATVSTTVLHTYQSTGTFTAILAITEAQTGTQQTQTPITVTAPPPVPSLSVTLTVTPPTPAAGTAVTLTAPISYTAGANVWVWNFGDGSTGRTTSSNATIYTYVSAGTYTAKVTVTDSFGRTASATLNIVVH
jgi:PKD repeat protein